MNSLDSVTKIVTQYFAAVTKESFTYRGRTYEPKPLRVSPGIFTRTMTCHPNCGGCCKKLTVDYILGETLLDKTVEHVEHWGIEFNGKTVTILRDDQDGVEGYFCRYLDQENGRCTIHGNHPFSCDFELLRFSMMSAPERPNQLTNRPFGRGWNMRRVDGERGARCEWDDGFTPEHQADVIRKLVRLKVWTDHFGIQTWLPEIVFWVVSGPHKEPLIVGAKDE